MNLITKQIPNAITCLNLFSGCIACVMAFQGDFFCAALFIYLAAFFDFLDGMAARLLKAYSDIGKELDSLADLVSFGVAPGVILFSWLKTIQGEPATIAISGVSVLPYAAFLITVFSALRLAKFNIDTRQTTSFIGLPTPANAIFIASLISLHDDAGLQFLLHNIWFIIVLICLLSCLLVCKLPMFSLKFKSLRWKKNQTRYIFLGLSIILLILFRLTAIPLIIILFILMSLVGLRRFL